MRQYALGFISTVLLILFTMGLTSNQIIKKSGKYQVDTLLLSQEDYVGNKRYDVLLTVFDTSTGDIIKTYRMPHSNYVAKVKH